MYLVFPYLIISCHIFISFVLAVAWLSLDDIFYDTGIILYYFYRKDKCFTHEIINESIVGSNDNSMRIICKYFVSYVRSFTKAAHQYQSEVQVRFLLILFTSTLLSSS